MKADCFTVFCQGETIGGDVTFWKGENGKNYYYQSDGIGKVTRCSKKLYDEAKALYEKQKAGVENE